MQRARGDGTADVLRSDAEATGGAGILPARSEDGVWHSRGYLPHFDRAGQVQMITFRLADSLPRALTLKLGQESPGVSDAEGHRRLEASLDAGRGTCVLRDPRIAHLVEDALLRFDGERYRLLAWVVMPNHVHVLFEALAGHPLQTVIHSWKSFTATAANRILARAGEFWQRDYFDRAVRDERHLRAAIDYIHANPLKAGLVHSAEDWAFSSFRRIA